MRCSPFAGISPAFTCNSLSWFWQRARRGSAEAAVREAVSKRGSRAKASTLTVQDDDLREVTECLRVHRKRANEPAAEQAGGEFTLAGRDEQCCVLSAPLSVVLPANNDLGQFAPWRWQTVGIDRCPNPPGSIWGSCRRRTLARTASRAGDFQRLRSLKCFSALLPSRSIR